MSTAKKEPRIPRSVVLYKDEDALLLKLQALFIQRRGRRQSFNDVFREALQLLAKKNGI
jgi:hypothetical protein